MGLPWYLNPLWEWDLHDRLDMLEGSSSSSRADDQRQDKEGQWASWVSPQMPQGT